MSFRLVSIIMALGIIVIGESSATSQPSGARNPVIFADVPDMSIIRVGDAWYMSSTTMHLSPGVPVMKSKDLVNWKIVGYAYDKLADIDELNLKDGKNAYGKGSWASCLRNNDGIYYLSTFAQTTNKTYIYTTQDIESGNWKRHSFSPSLHDHTLWFEDNRIFMIWGGGKLQVAELKKDLSGLVDGSVHTLIENATAPSGENVGLPAEGSQLFKHNGFYYLFNISWPRGGMRTVIVHRSKKLTGPYEGRVVLQDQGVAQGGLIDTPEGKWFAYLFQDCGAVGRTPWLVPVEWIDDWPVLGKNGKAPLGLDLPVNKGVIPGVVDSDEFNRTNGNHTLPLVWQWNHNPDESQWSLSDREGYFRLYAGSGNNGFHQVRNILTQRTFGPVCSAVVAIDVSHLQEGDFAGLSLFQKVYGQVGVRVRGGKRYVEMVNGDGQENSVSESILLKEDRIYLKASCDFRERADKGNFSYSLDGENWKPIGRSINMVYSIPHFMGYRFAMFCYSSGESGGFADFDWFRVNPEI
ncbi:beta-xylosidase [Bacteroidales bacterium 6E]|nr:beta-xylosidase [Bacteroidales bacterium 6E]